MRKVINFFVNATLFACLGIAQESPYTFHKAFGEISVIEGHAFPQTVITGFALSDSDEVAVYTRWPDAARQTGFRNAVCTSKRVVAEEGDLIEGKTITAIQGGFLQINKAGQVAYYAFFNDPSRMKGGGAAPGIFVDRHLAIALQPSQSGQNDFVLGEDGKLYEGGKEVSSARSLPAVVKPNWRRMLRGALPPVIQNRLPVTANPQQAIAQNPASSAANAPKACELPPFPYPHPWPIANGPASSHVAEPAIEGRKYQSPFVSHVNNGPTRIVYFNSDCQPLLVVIDNGFLPGEAELWSPLGNITHIIGTFNYGHFLFSGIPEQIGSTSFVRDGGSAIQINSLGHIAIAVEFQTSSGIIIGIPEASHAR